MKRTTSKERAENARMFYQTLQNNSKAAIVIERQEATSNPYVARTRFKAVCSQFKDEPKVIAESPSLGKEGCFIELLEAINPGPQVTLFEEGFADFLKDKFNLAVTYDDGMVMILQYSK